MKSSRHNIITEKEDMSGQKGMFGLPIQKGPYLQAWLLSVKDAAGCLRGVSSANLALYSYSYEYTDKYLLSF